MNRKEWAANVLRIPPNSTHDVAKQAHRDLLMVWHPDKYSGNLRLKGRAEEMAKEINLAFEVFTGKDSESQIPGTEERASYFSEDSSKPDWSNWQKTSSGSAGPPTQEKEPAASAGMQDMWWVEESKLYEQKGRTQNNQTTSRQTNESGGSGCAGGVIMGGLIGLLFGGWGAIPGALIGGLIGGSIGNNDKKSGDAVDAMGGSTLGCLGSFISGLFETVVGCGCVIAVGIVILVIIASLSR